MIDNFVVNGSNVCWVDGSVGGDQSPELSWKDAPRGTRSFVVVAYDTTAAFTHWGIYNIPGTKTGLPSTPVLPGTLTAIKSTMTSSTPTTTGHARRPT
jgi:prepilin-type processing-associated H-X9-DG protein